MGEAVLADLAKLTEWLDELRDEPSHFDLNALWDHLEQLLPRLPLEQQLQVAAEVIGRAAIALDSNAERLMQDWEDMTNPGGPLLRDHLFAGIVRYNMELDLSNLQADQVQLSLLPLRYSPRTPREAERGESLAAPVAKAQVIEMLTGLEQTEAEVRQQLAQLAGGEEVHKWQAAIATTLAQVPLPVPLPEVQTRSNLTLVEVWMGLLLGGYRLKHQGNDFYDASQVWVVGLG